MQVKDLIRIKRLEKGLTTTELGKLVGVSHATISRWESGNIATMKQTRIALLANALGISPVDLLKDDVPIEHMEFKRTADIGMRLNYFIQELISRDSTFIIDGIELDDEDIGTIITTLESSMTLLRKLIKSKHTK